MSDIKQFNGERLKIARKYRGLSVVELADKLGLQRQTVSMYENNQLNNPDFSSIQEMSNQLGFPIDFFLQKDLILLNVAATYFRSLLTTSGRYKEQQIEKIKMISQIYSFLEQYIEFPKLDLPFIQGLSIEDTASALREEWDLSDKPIENIVYLVEQHGIIVNAFDSCSDAIDAFSQQIDINGETRYLIGYSKNKSTASRIHFDIAHELGHIILHEWSEDLKNLSKEEFREREQQAHEFASCFLLPKDAFIKDIGSYATNISYYTQLKKKWKVSISAMIRRSYNLKLIDYAEYQQLMRTMQKKGIKKDEPLDNILVTAYPSLLRTSVKMLLEAEVFTAKEFVYTLSNEYNLSIAPREIELLLDLPKDTLKISKIIPILTLNLKQN